MSRSSLIPGLALIALAALVTLNANAGSPKAEGESVKLAVSKTFAPNSDIDWKQFQTTVQPFFAKNCYECHGEKDPENNFRLDIFTDQATLAKNRKALSDAYDKLVHNEMPPKKKKVRPEPAQIVAVLGWMDHHLNMDCTSPVGPGRVTIRRLNRSEYNNTIDDLLLIDLHPADSFPMDMSGYGFDNNGDVLTIAPVLMEKYFNVAGVVLDKVINAEPLNPNEVHRWDPALLEGSVAKGTQAPPPAKPQTPAAGRALGAGNANGRRPIILGRVFPHVGEIHDDYDFPKDGTYVLRLRGYGTAGSTNRTRPSVSFSLDGKVLDEPFTVKEEFRSAGVYSMKPIKVAAGKHRISIAFLNGATEEEDAAATAAAAAAAAAAPPAATAMPPILPAAPAASQGSNAPPAGAGRRGASRAGPPPGPPPSPTGKPTFGVLYFEAEGPTEITPERLPESYRHLMVATPSDTLPKAQAAEQIIRPFTTRAFRRPVTAEEMQSLMAFWSQADASGHTFNQSIQLTLQTVLASPQFLFRIESEPLPGERDNIHTLNDYELASRLSYFLWNSMPDEELFKLAGARKLHANLNAQVQRMLKDPRSDRFIENFVGQWLTVRQVQNVAPDATAFPGFDEALRTAMAKETELFFKSIVQEDRSVLDLIDANYSFLNERLAKHYGISGVQGDEFQRVTFTPNDHRGGLLTQASFLTITSYPARTSPVQRGKWVLENLLDDAPPPPPPNVPALAEDAKALTGTMRQRMEEHRTNPQCAACHARMDPIGFSLENYDATGAWRTNDVNHEPIDASGKLPDGTAFNGPEQLKNVLKLQKDKFATTVAAKMLTFALGRGLEDDDHCLVNKIELSMRQQGYKFSVLVNQIVNSDAFQKRSGKPESSPTQTASR
jgi:hypothetical protein